MAELKFLQVGLGSMGKRRIRNLIANGIKAENIFGFDLSIDRQAEAAEKFKIKTFDNFDQAVAVVSPDVYIISTPPDKHYHYFLSAAKVKKHFFVEVTNDDTGFDELAKLTDGSFVAAPSCTMRYLPSIKKIKELVDSQAIGKVLNFQYHLGQYLPDWHPWEDYRQVYFAQKSTGGCREMMPFELIWLADVLGSTAKKITGITAKVSDLDMTADDIYAAAVELQSGAVGTINIDLLARTPVRTLRIVGSEGVLDWNWLDYKIKLYQVADQKWLEIDLERGSSAENYNATEDMYEQEIKTFLAAVAGEQEYPFSFTEFHQLLKTLYALEQSYQESKFVTL